MKLQRLQNCVLHETFRYSRYNSIGIVLQNVEFYYDQIERSLT